MIEALQRVHKASVRKRFHAGTHRVCTPEETLARFRPCAAELGITRLGLCSGLDKIGIPVAFAVRPNAWSISVSQGKGISKAQAMASALMEAAELAHAERALQSLTILPGAALAPNASVLSPVPIDAASPANWVQGWDLLQQEPCWLPTALVHVDFRLPRAAADLHLPSCSNGLGSGNHILEALAAAISEVIERDSVAIWHARPLNHRAQTKIDLQTIDDHVCRMILEQVEASGMVMTVWDVTSYIQVPVFLAMLTDPQEVFKAPLREFSGSGCHPYPAIALSRALTEAAQSRLTRISGARDDLREGGAVLTDDAVIARMLLDVLGAGHTRSFSSIIGQMHEDVGDDVRWLLSQLRHAGISRVVAVDLTSPTLGLPVVRVVAPDLGAPVEHPHCVQESRVPFARDWQ